MDRRGFLQTTGYTALAAIAAANISGKAQAATNSSDFNIDSKFAEFMQGIGGSAEDAGGSVTFSGKDPILRSHFRIGACMAIPAMGAGVGAASVWRDRTGQGQNLKVDLRESIYNLNPFMKLLLLGDQAAGRIPDDDPIPGSFTFMPSINDRLYQAPLAIGHPLSFAILQTKDGKWVTPTAAYPPLYHGFLNVIDAAPNIESITKAVKKWDAEDLDDAVADAGMILGVHRKREEWDAHPQGKYLSTVPLVEIVKIGNADPVPYTADPDQPLSGIKGLSLTHVIAGNVAARTLAEYGADMMHIARPQSVEHDAFFLDCNVGMKSSFINLKSKSEKETLWNLISKTNVFIDGFRGRAIENLGFGVEEMAKRRPGIIYLSLRCYGWEGPWQNRGGFDMEGLTVSGFTMAEGGGVQPGWPPTRIMNDYLAGYLAAAGTIAALKRQAKEGGSYHVRVSLTRSAMWYMSLGMFPTLEFDATHPDHQMIEPEMLKGTSGYGDLHRLGPQVKLSKTPGRWREPLLSVRGSDRPEW